MSLFFRAKNVVSKVVDQCINLDRQLIAKGGLYILAYHRVLPAHVAAERYVQPGMWISPESFEQQICWMQKLGRIVSLDEIMALHTQSETTQLNNQIVFCLTFDDGWKDNYDYAFPILKKYGVEATIFVVTDSINSGSLFWVESFIERSESTFKLQEAAVSEYWHRKLQPYQGQMQGLLATDQLIDKIVEMLKRLSRDLRHQLMTNFYDDFNLQSIPVSRQVLNWPEVQEMAQHGIQFESHTHRHEIVKYVDPEAMRYELQESKRILESKLNRDIQHFCYPNGDFDEQKFHVFDECGYKYAYALKNRRVRSASPLLAVPRFLVYEDVARNASYFKCRLLEWPKFA